jgi:hypothetical protein
MSGYDRNLRAQWNFLIDDFVVSNRTKVSAKVSICEHGSQLLGGSSKQSAGSKSRTIIMSCIFRGQSRCANDRIHKFIQNGKEIEGFPINVESTMTIGFSPEALNPVQTVEFTIPAF